MSSGFNPPGRHDPQALRLGQLGAPGELWLPRCVTCGQVAYPLRELCGVCLSDRLQWMRVRPTGTVLASATLHHSNEPFFRDRLPLRIGSIQLDEGPVVIAFLNDARAVAGATVSIQPRLDESGAATLVAASCLGE